MRLLNRRNDRGLTLLELAVAVLVLSVGTIAALRAADQSRLAIGGAQDRVLASLAARNRIEELRLYGSGGPALPGTVVQGGQTFTIETRIELTLGGLYEATVLARSPITGTGASMVALLPGGPAR